MKNTRKNRRAVCAALIAAALICGAFTAIPIEADAEYAADVSPAVEVIRARTKLFKALAPAGTVSFEKEDFTRLLGGNTEHIVLLSLPEIGTLTVNGVPVQTNQPIKTEMISKMRYSADEAEGVRSFRFKDAGQLNLSALECVLNVCSDPTPPECGDIDLRTYRDVMILAALSETDEVEIMTAPANGVLTLSGRSVIYRPRTGFEGKDVFTYRLKGNGGVSLTAKVKVTVEKPFGNLFFADMKDSLRHREAIDLYRFTSLEPEKDENSNWIFDPDEIVSAQAVQRALREADPDTEEPVLLLPDETMTRIELAALVSQRANAGQSREKDFFGRLMVFFGGGD